jgi:hypothetical protein
MGFGYKIPYGGLCTVVIALYEVLYGVPCTVGPLYYGTATSILGRGNDC